MAKKDSKNKTSNKKATGENEAERVFAKQSEEIKAFASTFKELRKENDRFAKRLRKLEKDDTVKRLKRLERGQSKSAKKLDSLVEELKKTRSAAASVKRRKDAKSSSRSGKQRPGEESEPVITKAAEKKALDLGVNLSGVKGTGTEGRITVRDVRKRADKNSAKKTAKSRKTSKK